MLALTLHQPWATLIALGHKTIETRSWAAPKHHWDSLIAIHAAAREDSDFRETVSDLLKNSPTPKGAILAVVRLRDCVPTPSLWPSLQEDRLGDFSPGRFAWRLIQVQPLSEPIPCRGAQRLWTVPEDLVQLVKDSAGPAIKRGP